MTCKRIFSCMKLHLPGGCQWRTDLRHSHEVKPLPAQVGILSLPDTGVGHLLLPPPLHIAGAQAFATEP